MKGEVFNAPPDFGSTPTSDTITTFTLQYRIGFYSLDRP